MATILGWTPRKVIALSTIVGRPTGYTLGARPFLINGTYYAVWYGPSGELVIRVLGDATNLTTGLPATYPVAIAGAYESGGYVYALRRSVAQPTVFDLVQFNPSSWVVTVIESGIINETAGSKDRTIRMVWDGADLLFLLVCGVGTPPMSSYLAVYSYTISTGVSLGLLSFNPTSFVGASEFQTVHGYARAKITLAFATEYVKYDVGGAFVDPGYVGFGSGYHTHGGTKLYDAGDANSWELGVTPVGLWVIDDATPKFCVLTASGQSYFEGTTLKESSTSVVATEGERSHAYLSANGSKETGAKLLWQDGSTFYEWVSLGRDVT